MELQALTASDRAEIVEILKSLNTCIDAEKEADRLLKSDRLLFKAVLHGKVVDIVVSAVSKETSKQNAVCALKVPSVTRKSPTDIKLKLFMSLFRGRGDVYANRWENCKGKSGYAPSCANRWCYVCSKRKAKCSGCKSLKLLPFNENVAESHLRGENTIGIYPLLTSDECYFLAIDFDGNDHKKDVAAFRNVCYGFGVTPHVERSRSGNGAHVWFFFEDKIYAKTARKFGGCLISHAMNLRHEIDFKSYDRFFPGQDSVPNDGFGNLIALPLQKKLKENGNNVFVDENFIPYLDQWEYLSSIKKIDADTVNRVVEMFLNDVDNFLDKKPWESASEDLLSAADYPDKIDIVLKNMIYIKKEGIGERALGKLKRLACFKNPEFLKAQTLRLSTYDKPQIISCANECAEYIHLPRGLLEDVKKMFFSCEIAVDDKRNDGTEIDVEFVGELRSNQVLAVDEMLKHDNGILSATTAFGKTVVGINIITKRKTNTLILVHRTQLALQWKERIKQFSNINAKNIGQYGAGKNKLGGVIDIAVIQSVVGRGLGKEVKDFVGNYGMVIVDECHHVSAFSFEQVLKAVSAKYVYGLTATPKRQDGHDPIIKMQCGDIRYIADKRSERGNRGFGHFVIFRFTNFTCDDTLSVTDIYSELAKNQMRDEMIVKDVVSAFKNGRTPIVICNRKEHVKALADALSAHSQNVIVLIGGEKVSEKRQALERLKAIPKNETFIIVATGKYIGEGFDEPRLDTLFLAGPISWQGTLEQYVGRLHRNHEGKEEVVVYDYADIHSKILERMYQKRVNGYAMLGYLVRTLESGENNTVFSESEFENAFLKDVSGATKSVVISSPYFKDRNVKEFIKNIRYLNGAEITIFTTAPDERNRERRAWTVNLLQNAGVKVVVKQKLHKKFAVIDGALVWYGSVNLLGAGFLEESTTIRIPSREIGAELLKTLDNTD